MPDNGKQIIEDDAREEAIKQAMRRGEFEQAERLCHQWIASVEEHWVPYAQMTLADLAMRRSDYAEAGRLQRESLAVYENLGDKRGAAVMQGALADLAMRRGDLEQAEQLFTQAIATMQDSGDRQQAAALQGMLAQLLMVTNRSDEGCAMLKEAAQTLRSMGAMRDADVADQIIRENCDSSLQQEPPDTLDLIATNTIAVMIGRKDRREEWFGAMQQLKAQAQAYNDALMVALTEAVLKLLIGDSVESIQPELEGPFAACWDRIVEGIKNPPQE